jgi:hypothetical protein
MQKSISSRSRFSSASRPTHIKASFHSFSARLGGNVVFILSHVASYHAQLTGAETGPAGLVTGLRGRADGVLAALWKYPARAARAGRAQVVGATGRNARSDKASN